MYQLLPRCPRGETHFQQEKGHMQLHRNLEHPSVFGEGKQNVIPRAERIKVGQGWGEAGKVCRGWIREDEWL